MKAVALLLLTVIVTVPCTSVNAAVVVVAADVVTWTSVNAAGVVVERKATAVVSSVGVAAAVVVVP